MCIASKIFSNKLDLNPQTSFYYNMTYTDTGVG